MSWQNHRLTGQGQQFFRDTGEQEISISSGEIPSTDSPGEENIASEEMIRTGVMDADTSRTMPRNLVEIEGASQEWLGRSFMEFEIGCYRFDFQVYPETPQEPGISQHRLGDRVHRHAASVLSDHRGSIPDMVIVTVGKQEEGDRYITECLRGPFRGIDQHVPFGAGDQIGIGLQGTPGEHFKGYGCLIYVHLMMFAFPYPLCNGSV